jgi:hypothetical protein
LKRDGTCAETRFGLSAKRMTSPFKSAGGRGVGGQVSRLLAVEECGLLVMLDITCSEVEFRSSGYPLQSPVSPSPPLPYVTV